MTDYFWSSKNPEKATRANPDVPPRVNHGFVAVQANGLGVYPQGGDAAGMIDRGRALSLASEILRQLAPAAGVNVRLVIVCVECGVVEHARFQPGDVQGFTANLYREHKWVLSAQRRQNEVALAPVCAVCAPKVLPAELLEEMARIHSEPTAAPSAMFDALMDVHRKSKEK